MSYNIKINRSYTSLEFKDTVRRLPAWNLTCSRSSSLFEEGMLRRIVTFCCPDYANGRIMRFAKYPPRLKFQLRLLRCRVESLESLHFFVDVIFLIWNNSAMVLWLLSATGPWWFETRFCIIQFGSSLKLSIGIWYAISAQCSPAQAEMGKQRSNQIKVNKM